MHKPRTTSTALLNERRRQAVKLRQAGMRLADVVSASGLSAPTVVAAYKAFQAGGWGAVDVRRPGRTPGQGRVLDRGQEREALRLVVETRPADWGLPAGPWKSDLAVAMIERRMELRLSERTILRYLDRWGFLIKRSIADLHECSAANATAESMLLLYGRLRPLTLNPGEAGSRSFFVLEATAYRGSPSWLAYSSMPTAAEVIRFFEHLIGSGRQKKRLVFSGLTIADRDELEAWLSSQSDRLQVDFVSHSDHEAPGKPQSPPSIRTFQESTSGHAMNSIQHSKSLTHLERLEAESIHIMREVVAEAENPVMLYSIGKDSAVMLHLAMKAFYPGKPPFPLLHVDTTWKFREMYEFRDRMVRDLGLELVVHVNPEGLEKGINPFTHGSGIHTDIMKTEGLKQALDNGGYDAAFGGARRDEEKSRAKERIFSFRSNQHRWDPKNQRPELWRLYNARKHKGESIRVFPLSNWTELDIWQYIYLQDIPVVPLYFAKERPVVMRDGTLIMVDDSRLPLKPGEKPVMRKVRFRTLGCYPLTGAVESEADTLAAIIQEMLLARTSERQGRVIDHDSASSMEKKKQEGYF